MPKEDEKVSLRLKRLVQRFAQAHLARVFTAWKEEAEFERSVHRLESLLQGCEDVFDQPAHERSEAGLLAVLQLLQNHSVLSAMCPAAQRCIAAHAKLMVLSDTVELSTCHEDQQQLYAVLSGSVTLIHGDATDPQLQLLLHAAQQQYIKAVQEHQFQQPTDLLLHQSSADNAAAEVNSSTPAAGRISATRSNLTDDTATSTTSSQALSCKQRGMWHQVKEAVSAGRKRELHNSMMGGKQHKLLPGTPASGRDRNSIAVGAQLPFMAASPRTSICNSSSSPHQQIPPGQLLSSLDTDALSCSITLGIMGPGQCFCGCKFAQGRVSSMSTSSSPSAAAAAAAASLDTRSSEDYNLSSTTLPCSCLAAVAEPNRVVGLLVLSKPVYLEAIRLGLEDHAARIEATLCRLPCLRHTPVKELHRLAAHIKEATYEPGQLLLKQGREVHEIHFLISGSVLLTYSPPTNPAAAVAARLSLTQPPNLLVDSNNSITPAVQPSSTETAAAGIVSAVAAGGAGSDTNCAFGGKRSSGLADLLRLGQQAVQPATVVGVRGPGTILGDDAIRERRLAVGVVAATKVFTLKVEPQKFLSCMDPLTLRLFGRLRPQQVPAQQQLIQGALQDTGDTAQQQPQQLHRSAILADVYQSAQIPLTLLRPGDEGFVETADHSKPPWRSTRSTSPADACHGTKHCVQPCLPHQRHLSTGSSSSIEGSRPARVLRTLRHGKAGKIINPEDATWEAGLPRGLTIEKCVGLPQSTSVLQLLEVIRDVDEFRRMQGSLLLPSSDTVNMQLTLNSVAPTAGTTGTAAARTSAADICPPLASLQFSGATGALAGAVSTSTTPGYLSTEPAALAAVADAAAMATCNSSAHTELMEACGVAVLQLDVLPGQAVVAGSTIASAIDDVAASWAAIAHDEALQLTRWGAKQWMLLAQLEPGTSKRTGLEGLADAILACASRMVGVLSRSEGLPTMSLAAGVASGSCFVQYEAGNFVTSVSGHAYEAATKLCQAAASLEPTATAEFTSSSSAGSRIALLLSDGAACLLQSSFCLVPCNGGYLLTSARAALPAGPGARLGARVGFASSNSRQTLGPGRHTMLGAGVLLNPATPKTPGQGLVRQAGGKAQQRRQMRRKFEALQDLLTGAGDVLPPPPEHMLTQPPPVSMDGSGTTVNCGNSMTSSKAGGGHKAVNFSAASDSDPRSNTSVTRPGKGKKPNLKIALVGDVGGDAEARHVTPGSDGKMPHITAQLRGCAASGALTPTLIMDSPLSGGPQCLAAKQGTIQSTVPYSRRPIARAGAAAVAVAVTASSRVAAPPLLAVEGSNKSSITTPSITGSSRSSFKLRQQVWQEVAELRGRDVSTGAGLADTSGSSGTGSTKATPTSTSGCKQGSTRFTLDLQHVQCDSASAGASPRAQCTSLKGVAGTVAARSAGTRSALNVTFQSPRSSHGLGKMSPRQAHAANQHHAAASAMQVNQQQQQQQQQQHMQQEASLQSVNSMSLFPDPFDDASSSAAAGHAHACTNLTHSSTKGSKGLHANRNSSPGITTFQAVEAARLQHQRQQALVVSACKALGSFAAAEGYIAGLPDNLLAVNLSAAGLSRLPGLARLTQLENLSASFNHLSQFPKLAPADEAAVAAAVAAAADHASLALSAEQLQKAAATTAALAEELTGMLTSKVMSVLPATLTRLGLAYSDLDVVPIELPAALPQLTALDLSHNKLKELPCTFGALSHLKLLLVGHNQLAILPSSITRLMLMQSLDISHNNLTELPPNLDQLQSLSILRVQHNQLEQLPAKVTALTGLNSLSLGFNKLTQLLEGMLLQLTGLTSLDLAGNGLTDAALEAAAKAVHCIPAMAAAQLSTSTSSESEAHALQAVTVAAEHHSPRSASPLIEAPAATGPLPALRILDISTNKLHQLPSWLPGSLQSLLAAGNRIQQVHGDQLVKLSANLAELDLQRNTLQDLPVQLKMFTQLQVLALAGNPGLEPGIAESGSGMLWAYSWHAGQKSSAFSALLRGTHALRQQQPAMLKQRQQWCFEEVLPSLPGIRQTIIAESGRDALFPAA